jgi:ElaA protein
MKNAASHALHVEPLHVHWRCASFDALSNHDLYAILQARQEVFIVEQNCPYADADGIDPHCEHLCAWSLPPESDSEKDTAHSGGKRLLAYARIVPPHLKFTEASFGRVITTQAARGAGLGKELVKRALERLRELHPHAGVRIPAQQYLEKFYGNFGFNTVGEPYLEDGIPHVDMVLSS